jgi:hypothetical protein
MNGAGRRPETEPVSDPRPWEEPGAVRRDCAPHRANLLAVLGRLSLALGLLSALFGVPLLVGLPVSLATVLLAGRDLERMAAGAMDPRGREATERARRRGEDGLFLSVFGPFTAVFVWFVLVMLTGFGTCRTY